LEKQGVTTKVVEKWKGEMPTEQEMLPKDKYTIFDRKEKKYRKGIHSQLHYMKLRRYFVYADTVLRVAEMDKSLAKN
jgi:hypothetical protein